MRIFVRNFGTGRLVSQQKVDAGQHNDLRKRFRTEYQPTNCGKKFVGKIYGGRPVVDQQVSTIAGTCSNKRTISEAFLFSSSELF